MLFCSKSKDLFRVLELLLPQGEFENEIGFRQDDHNCTSKSAVPPLICSYSPESSSIRSNAESGDKARAPLARSESHDNTRFRALRRDLLLAIGVPRAIGIQDRSGGGGILRISTLLRVSMGPD